VRGSSPESWLPRALRTLAHEAVVTEDEPHPRAGWGAIAARCEHRRSRLPCHSRAISSGHQRYPADTHGHSKAAVGLGANSLTCGGGGARNCMACKGSTLGSTLPCPAGRSVPGRGGPERRRRPRPDGTGPGPCWVRGALGPQGHERSPAAKRTRSSAGLQLSSSHDASGRTRLWSRRSRREFGIPGRANGHR
jgi:hypothetical protein